LGVLTDLNCPPGQSSRHLTFVISSQVAVTEQFG